MFFIFFFSTKRGACINRLGMDKDEEITNFFLKKKFFAECSKEMNIVCMSEMGRREKNEIVMYLTEFELYNH